MMIFYTDVFYNIGYRMVPTQWEYLEGRGRCYKTFGVDLQVHSPHPLGSISINVNVMSSSFLRHM